LDRTQVLEKLEPICHTTVKQVVHSPRTKVMVEPGQVVIRPGNGGQLVPLSENGVRAMTNFVGLPQKVCKELSPDLLGRVATHLLGQKERYNLLIGDGEVENFAEFRGMRNLPADRVLNSIEQAIPECDYHRVSILATSSAILEIVGPKQAAVRRGDLVQGGAMVSFSPINVIMPSVQSYVLRLACTNGQTSRHVLADYTGGNGEGDNIWQWFRQSARAAYQAMGDVVNRYREMTHERIKPTERAGILEELLRQAGVTGKEAEIVRAQALAEPPHNAFDMMNLITWASSHVVRSPDRVQRTLAAGATFVSKTEHPSKCPMCHTRQITT